jgi:hypothetical protein
VPIVITIAAVAIIGGVVVVARGLGGELARDRAPLDSELDVSTGADVARYRPPPALLGYQPEATERAFSMIGRSIAERDEEIAWLRDRLAEVQPETGQGPAAGVAKPPGSATASQPESEATGSGSAGSGSAGSGSAGSGSAGSGSAGSDMDDSDTGPAVEGAASPQR